MTIPLAERGEYYRGLLVLMRKDRVITAQERDLMVRLGQSLDFDKRFCENAIDDLLKNCHIKDKPMRFSDEKIARSFLRHAVSLALVDGVLHPREMRWLQAVAHENRVRDKWLHDEILKLQANVNKIEPPCPV